LNNYYVVHSIKGDPMRIKLRENKITFLGSPVRALTVHAFSSSSRVSDYRAFSNRWIVDAEDGNGSFIIL
jgi:hypothetical protein